MGAIRDFGQFEEPVEVIVESNLGVIAGRPGADKELLV